MNGKIVKEGIIFDDVLLIFVKFDVFFNEVSLKIRFIKKIILNLLILSVVMDIVIELDLVIVFVR